MADWYQFKLLCEQGYRFRAEKHGAQLLFTPRPLLASSGNKADSNGRRNGGLIIRYVRTPFSWFTYTWVNLFILGQAWIFFWHFIVKKTRLPLPAMRLSCLYIKWSAYKYAKCEEGLWKNCVFIWKFFVYCRELMGSETFLMLILSKTLILHENIPPHLFSDKKMLLHLLGKLRELI